MPNTSNRFSGQNCREWLLNAKYRGQVTFDGLVEFLGGEPKKQMGSNVAAVVAEEVDGTVLKVAVRLYKTDIFYYSHDGICAVHYINQVTSQPFATSTTAVRMSQFGPPGTVFEWRDEQIWILRAGCRAERLADGMRFYVDPNAVLLDVNSVPEVSPVPDIVPDRVVRLHTLGEAKITIRCDWNNSRVTVLKESGQILLDDAGLVCLVDGQNMS